ncbi:MAG: flagellar motor switch protein FliG [Litoreibacter sp.]|nr:flagellar motor switch protein FliG [Litoreibacter sp.]
MQTKLLNSDDLGQPDFGVPALAGPQKAAIIVQMILSEGGSLPLTSLSSTGQARLMKDFVEIGRVDKATMESVVADLERDMSMLGLSFPRSVADALETLEAHLNPDVVDDLRGKLGLAAPPSPWLQITEMPVSKLIELIPAEDTKVAAIVLSKLDPEQASEVLDRMPPEEATELAFAMQSTKKVSPEMLNKVGQSLLHALPKEKPKAFSDAPELRVANMLNSASPDRRDELLEQLAEKDPEFAANVRSNIFTFGDIATRIKDVDVLKITRDLSQEELVLAMAYAMETEKEACEFILSNISSRMADAMREEIADSDEIGKKQGEDAMGKVTTAVRALADLGEISIMPPPSDDDKAGDD